MDKQDLPLKIAEDEIIQEENTPTNKKSLLKDRIVTDLPLYEKNIKMFHKKLNFAKKNTLTNKIVKQ